MTEPRIHALDALGAELARVAADRRPAPRRFRPARRPRLAVALSVLVVLGGGGYAVPPTRAAIEDLTGAFAGWVAGDDDQAPGRAVRPEDDAPRWVREEGGRLIAETDGVGLYASRTRIASQGTGLRVTFGGGAVWDTIDGWRDRFGRHAVIVLGTAPERGRFPLFGLTAASVERVELRYAGGPPLSARVDGGFVLMADPRRPLRELVAYDGSGRELERADVAQFSR